MMTGVPEMAASSMPLPPFPRGVTPSAPTPMKLPSIGVPRDECQVASFNTVSPVPGNHVASGGEACADHGARLQMHARTAARQRDQTGDIGADEIPFACPCHRRWSGWDC